MKQFYLLIILVVFFACEVEKNMEENHLELELLNLDHETEVLEVVKETSVLDTSKLEFQLIEAGLIDVQQINPHIMVDLKYASTDNFMGMNMYGSLNRAYLQPDVAHRLGEVQAYLIEHHPDLRLYVFDAVRPVSVQQLMWDALDSIPVNERVKFVSNPANKSIHNFGAAVDVSLFSLSLDTLLDMGAGYDDLRKIAYPQYEDEFLKKGSLTPQQVENRKLLRRVMKKGGFWVLPTEWWHFNAFSRDKCKELFDVIP